jgi:hypothetical protein
MGNAIRLLVAAIACWGAAAITEAKPPGPPRIKSAVNESVRPALLRTRPGGNGAAKVRTVGHYGPFGQPYAYRPRYYGGYRSYGLYRPWYAPRYYGAGAFYGAPHASFYGSLYPYASYYPYSTYYRSFYPYSAWYFGTLAPYYSGYYPRAFEFSYGPSYLGPADFGPSYLGPADFGPDHFGPAYGGCFYW